MADKPAPPKEPKEPRRLNRTVRVGEALGHSLDPVFKKRGFASRDLLTHWAAIAPKPYNAVSRPDRLTWPRGSRGAEGATLLLRCVPGHGLAIAHEGPAIAAAINRYFGYVLVNGVRLSAEPMAEPSLAAPAAPVAPETRARIERTVSGVADQGVRTALERLGTGLAARGRR